MPDVQPKPLIIAKQSPPAASPGTPEAVKLNITKKYVLPPRPKPGRKPSSETPPNRRKAQNREAQRAFRERRAAAVQELEIKLGIEAQKHAAEQQQLKDMIAKLASENEKLKQMRTPPSISPAGISPMSPGIMSPGTSMGAATASAMSPGASPCFYMSPFFDPAMQILDRVLDERLPVPETPKSTSPPKRPSITSTTATTPKKVSPKEPPVQGLQLINTDWSFPAIPLRRRLSSLETDFTNRFKEVGRRRLSSAATSPLSFEQPSPSVSSRCEMKHPEDRCGFCTDDTPCVCMEAAARERANMRDIETLGDSLPLVSYKRDTPSSAVSTPSSPATSSGAGPLCRPPMPASPAASSSPTLASSPNTNGRPECTGDPGTCLQCQEDPMSTLFCTTVAAKPKSTNVKTGTFIPAQAAYRTLSRHHGFSAADFSTLVGSLETRGTQVEVNSVAKVLRMLDRK